MKIFGHCLWRPTYRSLCQRYPIYALSIFLLCLSCSSASVTSDAGEDDTPPQFLLPVQGEFADLLLTDSFGPRILSDIYDFHRGLDIAQELDDPIFAAASGTVIHAGERDGYPQSGIFIILEHTNGYFTGYLHLNAIEEGITDGVAVTAGDIIGYAGSTGENITLVHLHFNIYQSDVSGEIPSTTNDTLPPLEFLDYDDATSPTVTLLSMPTEPDDDASVSFLASVPTSELDLNEVTLTITSGDTLFEKTVDYAERINCGTDDNEVNGVLIEPEDFRPSEGGDYNVVFTFSGIDLSGVSADDPVVFTVRATDIRGNEASDTAAW